MKFDKPRLNAALLILGACILLFRAVLRLSQHAIKVHVPWVFALLIIETLLDSACLLSACWWWITNDQSNDRIPLRLAAAAAILHGIRVWIFVLARVGPWKNFDIRPEQLAYHANWWTWGWLTVAVVLATSAVIGVIVIWIIRRRARKTEQVQ